MKPLILLLFVIAAPTNQALSQGCVAIRNIGGISPDLLFENIQPNDKLIFNVTNRYFEASTSKKATTFYSDTLVTNRIYTLNISVIKLLSKGWSLGLHVPVSVNSRNNGADHMGPFSYPKHTTHAFGLGDIRFTVYKWILDPTVNKKWNIQAGLGTKLPTGDFKYQDYFYRREDSTVLGPVDQAIQLGDGGTGITAELNAFYSFTKNINIYFQVFYLINPRDKMEFLILKEKSNSYTNRQQYYRDECS
jgi:hypothetical protein